MRTRTAHANVTKTAIGYVRVSTQEQATEDVSLDAQRDRLRSYCKSNSIKLIDIISDGGISGSTLDRPGLQAALRLIKKSHSSGGSVTVRSYVRRDGTYVRSHSRGGRRR